jgi:hypothetical protein
MFEFADLSPSGPQWHLRNLVYTALLFFRWAPLHSMPFSDLRPCSKPRELAVIYNVEFFVRGVFVQQEPLVEVRYDQSANNWPKHQFHILVRTYNRVPQTT